MKLLNCIMVASMALSPFAGFAQGAPSKAPAYAHDLQMENLGRGLVAIHNGKGNVSVSWRYLPSDPLDISFDLYKKTGKDKFVKLNNAPITQSTFFKDTNVDTRVNNTYMVKVAGSETAQRGGEYALTLKRAAVPYISIPMQMVKGDAEFAYAPNDASVADLDGDGEYEIIIKRENGGFDNSRKGLCKGTTLLEAYKLDGKMLWRVDLGINIRQGAHYTQFKVYDFDGDGRAEIAVKTSEGTRFGDGKLIGDTDKDGITDYRDLNPDARTYGMILKGPEFLSVIDGATGKELARDNFIPRGSEFEFGDNSGNRVDRFLGGVGYFDGKRPSILICRGYYTKTVLQAWDWREGKLTKRWTFDSTADGGKYKAYEGQGNHNLRIGDVDGDGKDEIVYGACLIDHDGTGGYLTGLGHGDAMHLTDIDIDRPGLEVWDVHEGAPNKAGSEMRDARSGEYLWGIPSIEDVGRGMCADIDPRFRGCEVWSSNSNGIYTAEGRFISEKRAPVNMAVWWTGDLNRELLDGGNGGRGGAYIKKWNGDGVDDIPLPGVDDVITNNGTKANPCIQADIFGDWREEIAVRTKDNKEVRIYMTDYPTDYRFHTLMSDPIYRLSVATQNIAYNQPTQPGFYLGSDLGRFWPERFQIVTTGGKSGTADDGRPNGMNARLRGATLQVMNDIVTDEPSYTFDARYDYDSYRWSVSEYLMTGDERSFTVTAEQVGYDKPVKVILRTTYKGCVFEDSTTLTFSKAPLPARR